MSKKYEWVVQGYYHGHWEDEDFLDSESEGKEALQVYKDNMPNFSHQLIKREVVVEVDDE